MLIALAGSIGMSVRLREYIFKSCHEPKYLPETVVDLSGVGEDNIILRFTELWTWAAAITDTSLSSVIILGLCSRKTGLGTPTDSMVSRIVATTMQSAALTIAFALAAAITDAITWQGSSYVYSV